MGYPVYFLWTILNNFWRTYPLSKINSFWNQAAQTYTVISICDLRKNGGRTKTIARIDTVRKWWNRKRYSIVFMLQLSLSTLSIYQISPGIFWIVLFSYILKGSVQNLRSITLKYWRWKFPYIEFKWLKRYSMRLHQFK